MKHRLLIILPLLLALTTADLFAEYLWPLPYGTELTSIFGSSRTRRYHAGIDMRTGGTIGKKVVAPANGYVSRVRTSYYGYGKAIYLRMEDGNTAVFGHLSGFTPRIDAWIESKQIASESYKQDLYPAEGEFPFKRGELIGYSGSTGVGAPHLHFEIRSPVNVPLNPIKLPGLEVEDNSAPRFQKLRIIGMGNDQLAEALGWDIEQSFKRGADGVYRLSKAIPCMQSKYWLSAEIVDFVSRNRWDKPTYSVRMMHAGRTLYELAYDELPFEEGYRIEIDRNYQAAISGDKYFYNFLPRSDYGDPLQDGLCGAISRFEEPVVIEARDVAGNLSRAEVTFDRDSSITGVYPVLRPDYDKLKRLLADSGYMDSVLIASVIPSGEQLLLLLKTNDSSPKMVRITGNGNGVGASSTAQDLGAGYYLAEITEHVSASANQAGERLTVEMIDATGGTHYSKVVCEYQYPWFAEVEKPGKIESPDGRFTVSFPPLADAFYGFDRNLFFRIDTLQTRMGVTYVIYPNDLPLAETVTYRYNSDQPLPMGSEFYADGGTRLYYLGSERPTGNADLALRSYNLGKLTVRTDDIAPSIRKIRPRRGAVLANTRPKVSCVTRDEMSGIGEDVEIRIDGRWLVPVYDFESHRLTATSHFELSPGTHTLVIKVTDKAGNTRTYDGEFSVARQK